MELLQARVELPSGRVISLPDIKSEASSINAIVGKCGAGKSLLLYEAIFLPHHLSIEDLLQLEPTTHQKLKPRKKISSFGSSRLIGITKVIHCKFPFEGFRGSLKAVLEEVFIPVRDEQISPSKWPGVPNGDDILVVSKPEEDVGECLRIIGDNQILLGEKGEVVVESYDYLTFKGENLSLNDNYRYRLFSTVTEVPTFLRELKGEDFFDKKDTFSFFKPSCDDELPYLSRVKKILSVISSFTEESKLEDLLPVEQGVLKILLLLGKEALEVPRSSLLLLDTPFQSYPFLQWSILIKFLHTLKELGISIIIGDVFVPRELRLDCKIELKSPLSSIKVDLETLTHYQGIRGENSGEVVGELNPLNDASLPKSMRISEALRVKTYLREFYASLKDPPQLTKDSVKRFNGYTLDAILEMTIGEASSVFKYHKQLGRVLLSSVALGLEHLSLNDRLETLSKGEWALVMIARINPQTTRMQINFRNLHTYFDRHTCNTVVMYLESLLGAFNKVLINI